MRIGRRTLVDADEIERDARKRSGQISVYAAAKLTGLRESTLRRGAREGWLPASKDSGGRYRFIEQQLLAAIERMKVKG